MAHTIIETGTPCTERQPPPAVWTIGPLEHFSQTGNIGKGKVQSIVIGRVIVDQGGHES